MEVLQLNPLEINHILGHVLAYVATGHKNNQQHKNIQDLLSCRLVATSWNKLAVPLLVDSGVEIVIDPKNIFQYLYCLQKCKSKTYKWSRSRSSKNQSSSTILATMKLHIITDKDKDKDKHKNNSTKSNKQEQILGHDEFLKTVHQLLELNCQVGTISTEAEYSIVEEVYWKLLVACSATLHELYLGWCLSDDSKNWAKAASAGLIDALTLQNSTFPALTSISYDLHRFPHVDNGEKGLAALLTCSPKLQQCYIGGFSSSNPHQVTTEKLTTTLLQRISSLSPSVVANLVQLEILIANSRILSAFCTISFPALQKLKLRVTMIYLFQDAFLKALRENIPALASIELDLYCMKRDAPSFATLIEVQNHHRHIPQLHKNIKTLEILYRHSFLELHEYSSPQCLVSLALVGLNWPSLRELTIDLVVVSILAKNSYPQELTALLGNMALPTVSTLSVHLKFYTAEFSYLREAKTNTASWQRIKNHFGRLFPSLNKLILHFPSWKIGNDVAVEDVALEAWLNECGLYILLSLPGIQRLELGNYKQDWLRALVNNETDTQELRQNLLELRLNRDWTIEQQKRGVGARIHNLKQSLIIAMKNSHRLDLLQIHQHLLLEEESDNDDAANPSGILQELNDVRNKCKLPSIKLQLI